MLWNKKTLGTGLGVLSFVTLLVYLSGPEALRYPSLIASLVLGVVSWALLREKRGPQDVVEGVSSAFAAERDWIFEAVARRLPAGTPELVLEPGSFEELARERKVIYVRVVVDGAPLERPLVVPVGADWLSSSEDSQRYLVGEQLDRLVGPVRPLEGR